MRAPGQYAVKNHPWVKDGTLVVANAVDPSEFWTKHYIAYHPGETSCTFPIGCGVGCWVKDSDLTEVKTAVQTPVA